MTQRLSLYITILFRATIFLVSFFFISHLAHGAIYYAQNNSSTETNVNTTNFFGGIPLSTQSSGNPYLGIIFSGSTPVPNPQISLIVESNAGSGCLAATYSSIHDFYEDYALTLVATTTASGNSNTDVLAIYESENNGAFYGYAPLPWNSAYCYTIGFGGVSFNTYTSGTSTMFSSWFGGSQAQPNINIIMGDSTSSILNYMPPEGFYAKIENTGGSWSFRQGSSTSATILKTLPEDWVVHISSTKDVDGSTAIANGYQWYQVSDPTDGVNGWMAGSNASGTTHYISSYDGGTQSDFIAKASSTYDSSSTRATLILQAIDNYYNNTSTVDSIYNSDDGSNSISTIKDRDFPEKVLWSIAAVEDGGSTHLFNNENVSFDYGHGIMQLTFNAWGFEPGDSHATFDHRGEGTGLVIPACASLSTSTYVNCYTHGGEAETNPKQYKDYGYSNVSTTYKYYTNTYQSIYSNIKDGLRDLQNKFPVNQITTSTIPSGTTTTYSGVDREMVIATANYNGASTYLAAVADRLENIDDYFLNQTSSDMTDIINKLDLASDHSIYVQLHSPGDLSISDSKGRTIGVVDGVITNDFPFASYDPETKSAKIFFPEDDDLRYKVTGTGTGVYGLDITITSGTQRIAFQQNGSMHITPGETHTYSIDEDALLSGGKGVIRKIDKEGGGRIDEIDALDASISNIVPPELLFIPNPPISRQTKFDFKQAPPPIIPKSAIYQSFPTSTNFSLPPTVQLQPFLGP